MWRFIIAQANPPSGIDSMLSMLPMFAVLIAVFYFLIIRPQQKKDQEKRNMMDALAKGDKAVTIGGIVGTVVGITDTHVVLRVDDTTKIEFVKSCIAHVDTGEDQDKE